MIEFEFHLEHFDRITDMISSFGQQIHIIVETEPYDFLKMLVILASFSYKLFVFKKAWYVSGVDPEMDFGEP